METPIAPDITKGQRGVFILLEGLDRSGKSTHAKNLAKTLSEEYHIPTKFQAFPDRTTQTGQKINDFLQNKLDLNEKEIHQLFLSNRFEAQQNIRDLLQSGVSLVVDRYSFSGACFSAAKKIPDMDLKWCFSGEIGLPAPDVVIYMNVSPEVAEKRGGYGEERFETKDFQAAVRQQFDTVINMSPSWAHQREVLGDFLKKAIETHEKGQEEHGKACEEKCSDEVGHATTPLFPIRDTTSPNGYITPWYKVSSDGEFADTAKAVLNGAAQTINLRKYFAIDNIQQFPQLEGSGFKFL